MQQKRARSARRPLLTGCPQMRAARLSVRICIVWTIALPVALSRLGLSIYQGSCHFTLAVAVQGALEEHTPSASTRCQIKHTVNKLTPTGSPHAERRPRWCHICMALWWIQSCPLEPILQRRQPSESAMGNSSTSQVTIGRYNLETSHNNEQAVDAPPNQAAVLQRLRRCSCEVLQAARQPPLPRRHGGRAHAWAVAVAPRGGVPGHV